MGRKTVTIEADGKDDKTAAIQQAAKEFASTTSRIAKELLEATEKAADKLENKLQPKRRGRKLLKRLAVFGIIGSIIGNPKVRTAITQAVAKAKGQSGQSQDFGASPNGEIRQPAETTTI